MPRFSGRLNLSCCALVLTLWACSRVPTPSGQVVYQNAVKLLLAEHFQEASIETERGMTLAAPGTKLAWNFRLLRVQILLARRETKRAIKALDAAAPPDRPDFAEQMARYRLCQSHAASLSRDTATAQARLDDAERLATHANASRLLAEIAFRRAALATTDHDPDHARKLLLAIIDPARHQDQDLRISATNQMGYLLLHGGRYDEAVPWFKKAAAQAKASGLETTEARAVSNLGVCLLQLGDLDKALRNFRYAESTFNKAGISYERQISLGNIGNIEENNRDYQAAAADYRSALAIARDLQDDYWTGLWLDNLALVSIELKDWDAAERYNTQALLTKHRVKDEASVSYSSVNAGMIANGRNQYQEAQRIFQTVLQRPHEDVKLILDAHAGLAAAYAGLHRDHEALAEFQRAVAVMSRQQALLDEDDKLTWFSSVIRVYHEYVGFLLDRGKTLDALEVVQSSRGRVLSSRLGEAGSHPQPASRDLQRIASQSRSTLLVYFVGPQKSYLWAVSSHGVQNYELPPEPELRRLVSAYDAFIQQLHDPLREENSAGRSLYQQLIAPVRLTTGKVILAPDGALYSLNFATLPVPGASGPHYWIEDVRLSIAPSFDLAHVASRRRAPSLLLIGNPVSEDSEFPELVFAGQEIQGIQQHLPGVRQVTYSRRTARPGSYKQAKPEAFSWIHFVAHATANQDEPLQSAVILSRDTDSEYRLFARDVLRIPLHADLVTISACHGAGAKIYQGEGLVGFSWAFLRSGARNVIAGLWDVNDRSTAELMADLYGELGTGKSPDEALRVAQLTMLHSSGVFRKPFYWGPFEVFRAAASE